jgi:polysaccharide export outer membrane protein
MTSGPNGIAWRGLARLFQGGTAAGLSDRQLLQRFAASRDELAFAALVERHGPMVLGVCRRILRDPHAAEDAFQATFLVLVRKAASLRVDDSLGRWLYTVTRRIALRVASRHEVAEASVDRPCEIEDGNRAECHERIAVIHEELGRLPESYRAILVLCHLQDLTHEEASRRLGWPVGTVKGRLVRARSLLRSRLVRRGLGLSLGTLAGTLRPISVTASLTDRTVSAAIGFAAYRSAAVGVFPAAVNLAKGALDAMFFSKLKLVAVGLAAFGAGAFVAGSGIVRLPRDVMGRPVLAMDGPTQGAGSAPAKADTTVAAPGFDPRGTVISRQFGQSALEQLGQAQDKEAAAQGSMNASLRFMGMQGQGAGVKPSAKGAKVALPEYVVEPPDILVVEVVEALPAQPIKGERLVRPDGTISLGWYGDIQVSGLTITQIKEAVIAQLRKHLGEKALGLVRQDGDRLIPVEPKDSSRVFVDVSAYNSKVYYVQGEVASPGRLNITGNETVLDAINYAGGLLPTAANQNIRLVRPASNGAPEQTLPINLAAIINAGDTTTNYQLKPNDRLVVYRDPDAPRQPMDAARQRAIEQRIDGIIRELEALKNELKKPAP